MTLEVTLLIADTTIYPRVQYRGLVQEEHQSSVGLWINLYEANISTMFLSATLYVDNMCLE